MTGNLPAGRKFLPPGYVCSAYWYAQQARLLTGDGDLEFLRELGYRAACLARWHGIPPWQVPEGPYWVFMRPEWVWSATVDAMAQHAAEYGDYGPPYPPGQVVNYQQESYRPPMDSDDM